MLLFRTPMLFRLLVSAAIIAGEVFNAAPFQSLLVLFKLILTTILDAVETPGRIRAQASCGVAVPESSMMPFSSMCWILALSNFRQ